MSASVFSTFCLIFPSTPVLNEFDWLGLVTCELSPFTPSLHHLCSFPPPVFLRLTPPAPHPLIGSAFMWVQSFVQSLSTHLFSFPFPDGLLTFSYLAVPVSPTLLLCLPDAFIAVIQIKTSSTALPVCRLAQSDPPALLQADSTHHTELLDILPSF